MKTCVVTIVSANYLAYARVLGESLLLYEPGMHFKVLIVDRPTSDIRAAVSQSGLDAVFAEELGLSDFESIAFKYDIVELNTALKPSFLKRQFGAGFETVIYLDPDIRLFASLTPVTEALARREVVLIPHTLAPALDGLRPSDIDFLRSGAYNLGFIALRQGSDSVALLDWWEHRCLNYGFNDLGFGTFVDQKWIDLVPSYFGSVDILRDSTCNVAYWNLHEREVTLEADELRVQGRPLSFFHFSGVKAEVPSELSRHQTRHRLVPGTPLAAMVADYCSSLIRLEHRRYSTLAYTFGRFDNGAAVTRLVRRTLCAETSVSRPFAADGKLYRDAQARGWLRPGASDRKVASSNTLNFDPDDRRVLVVNRALRAAAKIIGAERVETLLRYAAFLTRQSNFARVLLRRPFDLNHGFVDSPPARRTVDQ